MAKILKLDKHVAELIAAGEVVERPSSVVKELVENSVDAGATAVTVEIKRGGLELIRVSDNGSGIAAEDVPTAFLRHATSKVVSETDLESIITMGFRGEALASIAAVSKTELFTRRREDDAGTCYIIHGGAEVSNNEAGCRYGTTIVIRELFYNTPARMKFIKRDITEAGQVTTVVRRAALGCPEVSFKLIKDGETILHTPGDGLLHSAIYAVYGRKYAGEMVEIKSGHEGIEVSGFVSRPLYSQGNRTKQEFFVNSRPVRSRIMGAALEEAYKNTLMQKRYPSCVLHIGINPSIVDVNVHPSKSEVKFAYDRNVFDAIYYAVKGAVAKADGVGSLIADVPEGIRPRMEPEAVDVRQLAIPATESEKSDNANEESAASLLPPIRQQHALPEPDNKFERSDESSAAQNGAVYSTAAESASPGVIVNPYISAGSGDGMGEELYVKQQPMLAYKAEEKPALPSWRILGEAFDTFIIVQDGEELYFIDKHAAHERIIFERLLREAGNPITQILLRPVILQPEKEDYDAIISNLDVLAGLGFEAEEFGGGSIIVRAVPEGIDIHDTEAALGEIAESFRENRRLDLLEKRENALRLVACKAAIKAGSAQSYAEKYTLVEAVMGFDDIKYCPHGRPVAVNLKRGELEKRFGRIT